ncbi:LCP family protein [Cellulomonas humilata]|uniref:LCP family protein required for cell wall assembly n=1 Tax=Cellulomonas humilata TaxID=144055 RepID=A0ABU0ED84_9CELL|nr:LCP family protein [Cellulomonas humilata]MDQ0373230.1 LCP family protein required for cell wall assembly [Cellulomonas humilata]
MTLRHAAVQRPRAARHSRRLRTHGVARAIALGVTAVVVFGASGVAAVAAKLNGNMDKVDVSALVNPMPTPTKEPDPDDPNAGQAVNLLILGSDQRDGLNGEIGGDTEGMRSDTTMVLHISADRSRVELVSIPRDSLVDIPSCTMTNGKTTRATHGMFNSAFATGWDNGGDMTSAAACTINTVQLNTGLTIDHFVVVDFAGFQQMVDSIGGVPMCIPHDMSSEQAQLELAAGFQTLDGPTALAYARARKGPGVGDGSDTNRIGNQQKLIAAMVREVLSRDVLTNPQKLISFLSAATGSLTTDSGMSIGNMTGLAYNLRNISSGNITFMTIPFAAAKSDPNRVEWTSAADAVWANMVADTPALGETPVAPVATTPPPTTTTTAPVEPVAPVEPAPVETKKAGQEAFSVDDTTDVC